MRVKLFSAFSLIRSILLIIFLLSFHTLSINATSTFGGNETDRLALLAFRAKIMHDPRNTVRSWNDSVHFCNWVGVSFGRRHRRFTILDVSSKGLMGSLSPFVGNESFLRKIRLYNNTLQGKIPPELGHLFRLKVLNLGINDLEGKIPSNLSHCSNLVHLFLPHNKLIGKIPVELASLSKLMDLTIHENYLTGGIPPFIGNLSSLETLSIADNVFGGSIPYALGKLKYLSAMGLGGNKLSGTIPPAIYNISSISILSSADNQIHGSIPSNIGLLLPLLQNIQVWGNHFSGSIPVSLSNASRLQYIDLSFNNFTGKVAVHFGQLQQLVKLSLHNNNLGSKEGDDLNFITSLTNCSSLLLLQLTSNQLNGVLPNSVANLFSTLEILLIGGNQIYGSLLPGLSNLVSLSTIIIYGNQFTSTIPIEIGNQKLQLMYLGDNRLSGKIPFSFRNLSLLIELHMGITNCKVTYLQALEIAKNLMFLNLSQNQLTGSIPRRCLWLKLVIKVQEL